MFHRLFLSATLLTLVGSLASASTIFGNPKLDVVLDSGPPVFVSGVRAYGCPGKETVMLNQTLSTSGTLVVEFSESDWCGLAVQVRWSGNTWYDTVPVEGFTTLVTEEGAPTRTIVLDPVTESASLQ